MSVCRGVQSSRIKTFFRRAKAAPPSSLERKVRLRRFRLPMGHVELGRRSAALGFGRVLAPCGGHRPAQLSATRSFPHPTRSAAQNPRPQFHARANQGCHCAHDKGLSKLIDRGATRSVQLSALALRSAAKARIALARSRYGKRLRAGAIARFAQRDVICVTDTLLLKFLEFASA